MHDAHGVPGLHNLLKRLWNGYFIMSWFNLSVDVEEYGLSGDVVLQSLKEIVSFAKKKNIRLTFFVTGTLLEAYPSFFHDLEQQGIEIASHGYDHRRFDDLSWEEKKFQFERSLAAAKKANLKHFVGFRAPQHSIKKKDLPLLSEYGFVYDSSLTSGNSLQFIFFPKRFFLSLSHFFTRPYPHRYGKIKEIPPSSFILPMVSMSLRLLPLWLMNLLFFICKKTSRGNVVFYIHSWDFLELQSSTVYRLSPKDRFIKKLESFVDFAKHYAEPKLLKELE